MEYFWDGFEKRAVLKNIITKGKTLATNLAQKGKSFATNVAQKGSRAFGGPGAGAQGPVQSMAGAAKNTISHEGRQFKDNVIEGFKKQIEDHAKSIGGGAAKHVTRHIENIAKNIADPSEIYKALHELGSAVGVVKRPPSLLERAGSFVKEHPIGTGAGVVAAGGAAYGAGRAMNSQPQPQPYQYYNPYYQ
jgi:hypothetical protein